ncbi:MAG: SufS family cysteine desulfurase [Candidatus Aenigmarchaeota archaeon]|jgi:cysteine desulfurase/selenocysteine lyase|nr:SufS family cysteine desulfurase [Candidatus Aenigmarchaeota archaeon]
MIDIKKIRDDFPIFKNNPNLIYFDNAASTQKPKQVIEKIKEVYEKYYSNIHRGVYNLSIKSSEMYEDSHKIVANFINAKEWSEIIFTKNTTEAINLIAYSFALNNLKKGDKIVLSVMEHHSNLVPWQFVSKKTGATLEYIGLTKDYRLDLNEVEKKIDEKTKIVAITNMSNVLGTINEVEEIIKIAHEKGAIVVVDGAQSVPHMKTDVRKIDADFLAFSAHKMLGPSGIGVLYGKKEVLEKMDPFLYGGDMISDVDFNEAYWNELPWKFEAGTPNICDGIAFMEAIEYLKNLGMENVETYERSLIEFFLKRFNETRDKFDDKIELIGPNDTKNRGAVFSLFFKDLHPHFVAKALDLKNIAVRSGYHCAHPLMKYLKIFEKGGTVRASLYVYNTKEEIERFFEEIENILKQH